MSTPRSITPDDLPAVDKLLNTIFRLDNRVFDQNVIADFPLVFVPENFSNCRVLEADGRIVSHAAIFPCQTILGSRSLLTAVIILVATDRAYRHQGHAARLMRDLQETMHREAYDLGVLWTGVPDFYAKLGWQTVVPRGWVVADLRDHQPLVARLAAASAANGQIAAYDPQWHRAGIQQLHDREAVRVRRSDEEYATLLQLPKITVWVRERGGEVVAYAVIGQAVNKHGVIEYGGAAEDIVVLIDHALRHQQLDRPVPLLIFHPREDLAELLRQAGEPLEPLECSKGRGCEMIYLVDPNRLAANEVADLFLWGLDFT